MSTLKDKLETKRNQIIKQAEGTIQNLADIAGRLDMKDKANNLKSVKKLLSEDNFHLIIVGRFKTGKSTLMNALLGPTTRPLPELDTRQGIMPTDDMPATATLTSIRYSENPYVRIWYFDGKHEDWSLMKYRKESTVRDCEEENKLFFEKIREFEVGYPAELCKSGVTLIDSPGTSDVPHRTSVTRGAVQKCDAAIMLYRSEPFAGEDERKFAAEVFEEGTHIFTVVNLRDGKRVDDRFKAFVWNRLVKEEKNGPKYDGQDFSSQNIYFIDGLKAEQGKLNRDENLMMESGLIQFEQVLGDFLVKKRYKVHLQKFVRAADRDTIDMQTQIDQRCAALQQDEEKFRQAYEATKPKFEEIRKRQDKFPKIFDWHQRECRRELKTSFEQMINDLRRDLPKELKSRKLTSMEGVLNKIKNAVTQKKICEEANDICVEIINSRVNAWGADTKEVFKRMLDELTNEISKEVAYIESDINDIQFQLTSWKPQLDAPTGTVSLSEKIIGTGMGILLGDPLLAFGGLGGFKAIAGQLAGAVVAGLGLGALSALGIAIGPLFFPAVIIVPLLGGIWGGGIGLEDKVKEKVLKEVDKKLQDAPREADKKIDYEIEQKFDLAKKKVSEEVSLLINQEEEKVRKMLEMNKRSEEEKKKDQAMLADIRNQIDAQRKALNNVLVLADQSL